MPNELYPLDPNDGPLEKFAYDLRELRESAPRKYWNAGKHPETGDYNKQTRDIDGLIDAVRDLGRATVYAALSGKRMPLAHNLRKMVEGWTAHLPKRESEEIVRYWLRRRLQALNELALLPPRSQKRGKVPTCRDGLRLTWELHQLAGDPEETGISEVDQLRYASYRIYSRGQIREFLAGRSIPSDEFLEMILGNFEVPDEDRNRIKGLARAARMARDNKIQQSKTKAEESGP